MRHLGIAQRFVVGPHSAPRGSPSRLSMGSVCASNRANTVIDPFPPGVNERLPFDERFEQGCDRLNLQLPREHPHVGHRHRDVFAKPGETRRHVVHRGCPACGGAAVVVHRLSRRHRRLFRNREINEKTLALAFH